MSVKRKLVVKRFGKKWEALGDLEGGLPNKVVAEKYEQEHHLNVGEKQGEVFYCPREIFK